MSGRSDYDSVHILRYMGSKHRLLSFICPHLERLAPPGTAVCDLMAGTQAIGIALRRRNRIFANDVQLYSQVLGRALVVAHGEHIDAHSAQAEVVDAAAHVRGPFHLFESMYADTYFSREQCQAIDRLRRGISAVENPFRRDLYLCALMYAMCYAQSTPGHFAEFLPRTHPRVATLRNLDIEWAFLQKADELGEFVTRTARTQRRRQPKPHVITCLPYDQLLASHASQLDDVRVFYVDPPYTAEQYSRFYHLLETLVRYDFPEVAFKGRYRTDRFQSDFSRRARAAGAFQRLFAHLARFPNASVVVSYGSRGLVPIDRLTEIAEHYYHSVQLESLAHDHSTQGKGKTPTVEYLLICSQVR